MNKLILAMISVACMACSQSADNDMKLPAGVGIVLANRDTTITAAEDFFRYVNGGWIKKTVIPADRGVWGSFIELREHNSLILKEVLKKAGESKEYLVGTDQRKVADFYAVGMDSLATEKAGLIPLKELLVNIQAITNKSDLQDFLTRDDLMCGDAFFNLRISPDVKDSKKMTAFLGSGGIGLPERDYYLKFDSKSLATRERYGQHVLNMLLLSGWDASRAKRSADRIMLIETELAKATLTKEEKRDPHLQYNRRSVSELSVLTPSINWQTYFLKLGVKEDSVIVTEPAFLKGVERILNTFSLDDVKNYLRWTVLRQAAPFLNSSFVNESFEFNTHYLMGAGQLRPRWKRVLETSEKFLGEAIGKLYVAEVFPPDAKRKAIEMVENIKFAFADRIKQLDWMSDSTKKRALKKLSAFTVKIGYPDNWKNYSGLGIESVSDGGSYYANIIKALQYQVREEIAKLGKPVDKAVWGMTPQTVNAYYNPPFNEIVFPAGILQPPFYDYRADEAVNYGGIGGFIGHEISHGFDDQGSQYDAAGNLNNWWAPIDLERFKAKAKALAEQFNRYEPLPGLFVQGQFTLGENIGDLGGLSAAHDALSRFYRETNTRPGLIDGLTSDQRFFMSWATAWRAKYRDEALRTQVLTNEHAPAMYRANGPVSNMKEFYDAFGVKPGSKMYREEKDRIRIW